MTLQQTNLRESPMVTNGRNPPADRPGVYKRCIFIQSPPAYSRWDGRVWYIGFMCRMIPEEDVQAHARAAAAGERAAFQNQAGWWGLAEEPLIGRVRDDVVMRSSPGCSTWLGTVDSSDGGAY